MKRVIVIATLLLFLCGCSKNDKNSSQDIKNNEQNINTEAKDDNTKLKDVIISAKLLEKR